MTPTLAALCACADDVAVHERDGGFFPHERFKPHRPGVVYPHHHLMFIYGSPVGRVEKNATVSHHCTGAILLPSADEFALPKSAIAFVNGSLHILHQVLHDLGFKAPVVNPGLQQHSHLGPEGPPHVGIVEDLQLPACNLLPHHRHEHHVPIPALSKICVNSHRRWWLCEPRRRNHI